MIHQYLKREIPHKTLKFWQEKILSKVDWIPDETQRYNWVPSNESKISPPLFRNAVMNLVNELYSIDPSKMGDILLWDGSEDLDWHADGDGDDECKDKDVVIAYLDVFARNINDIGTISIGERTEDKVEEIETVVPYDGLTFLLPTTGSLVHKVSKTNVSARRITLLVGIKA